MELLFHIRCHKILDNLQVKKLVVIVLGIVTQEVGAILTLLPESKIITFVINGESDTSKDNRSAKQTGYLI